MPAALATAYAQGATDEAADHGRPPEAVLAEIVGMVVGDMLACTWLSVALLEEPDIASLVQIFGGRSYVRAVLAWRDATREWQISRKWNDRPAPVAPPLPSVP
jgi:hypothetical protein